MELQCKNCGLAFTSSDSVICPQCGSAAPYKRRSAGYWTAGYNSPGYMPEMTPAVFATFEEAKRFLIGEMATEGDSLAEMARDEQYDADDRAQYNTEAEELSASAEGLNLERRTGDPMLSGGTLQGDDYSEWGDTVNGTAYWIRWDVVAIAHVHVFTCPEVDELCVLWRGALTFNVHTVDPYAAEGLDIGREVDVFTFGGPDAPTFEEAEDSVGGWFAHYVMERSSF